MNDEAVDGCGVTLALGDPDKDGAEESSPSRQSSAYE